MIQARNQVIYAPSNEAPSGLKSVFLAGTTSEVDAHDWREALSTALSDVPVTIYNPYRADWDSSWREDINFTPYREQVEWELEKQDKADIVVIYFHRPPRHRSVCSSLGSVRGFQERLSLSVPRGTGRGGMCKLCVGNMGLKWWTMLMG